MIRGNQAITFCLSLLLTCHLQAQTTRSLEGYVTDKEGNPISGVSVTPKMTDLSATTDEKGYYQLKAVPDSFLTLNFSHPLMEDASASIGIYSRIDVTMVTLGSEDYAEISLEDLLNLQVTTVSKSAEKLSDAPGVISVLTKDEINRFGGLTLKDLLERMPGLIGSTVYMTDRSTIAPRGDQVLASSSHVLLLINGRPVRESLEGGIKSEMYEAFPVNIIDRIEVIRGPGSVLYGSNAYSAVINVITQTAKEKNIIAASAMGSFEGGFGGSLNTNLKFDDLYINFGARHLTKPEWETDWMFAVPPAGDSTVNITIPNVGSGLYFDAEYKGLRLMTSYTQWEHYYYVTDFAFIFPGYGTADWSKTFADIGYGFAAGNHWDMDFNVTYTRSKFKTQNWPSTNRDSYEMVGEWTNFYNPSEKLNLVFGALFNYFDGEEWGPGASPAEKVYFSDSSRYSAGAYAQLNYRILKGLNLIGGLQANKVEALDVNVVPRVGLIWYPIEKIFVKAFYSEAFRAPSINEFSINFPQMMGNPGLTPEKVNTFDIGVGYQGEKVYLAADVFYSKFHNIIFQNRDTNVVDYPMYWNGGEVEFMGVELEGRVYLTKQLYITGSMIYQTNENQAGIKNVTPIANLGVKGGISYSAWKGITASIFDIYQGDLDDGYKTQINPSPGAYNYLNLYIDINLVDMFKLGMKQDISLFIQADNILNQEIWLPTWGLLPGSSVPVNHGMSVFIGAKAVF